MKIIFDLDNVLFPFSEDFRDFTEAYLGRDLPEIDKWEIWDCFGITKEHYHKLFREYIREGRFAQKIINENVYSALVKLYSRGHEIYIVTARGEELGPEESELKRIVRIQTVHYLSTMKIPHSMLTFTKKKGRVNSDVLIDDNPDILTEYQQDSGKLAVCWDRLHNKNWTGARAYTTEGILTIVEELENEPVIVGESL